jgi:DNA-binding XRE family transcriptional regulator
MQKNRKSPGKQGSKDLIITGVREKLGISQGEFAAILGVSRTLMAMAEGKERNLPQPASSIVTKMAVLFFELEKGIKANYRSLETRLLLNDIYKTEIPLMKAREKECRLEVKRLAEELEGMRQREKNAENAIIVYTTILNELREKEDRDAGRERQIYGFELFKQRPYDQLTGCWAPAQVKLQAKIEALRAEARTLRRTRLTIMREHHPFKK